MSSHEKSFKCPEFFLFLMQTWPYIFQQVPELVSDLNANKVSNSTSRKENNSNRRTNDFTLCESPQKFTQHEHHEESHLRGISQFYSMRCQSDDFEMGFE